MGRLGLEGQSLGSVVWRRERSWEMGEEASGSGGGGGNWWISAER